MKKRIHPKLAQTLIQMKDGSTYTKRWLFFRPVLSLEIDYLVHYLWRKQVSTKFKK